MKRFFLPALLAIATLLAAASPALAVHDGPDGHAMSNQRLDGLLRELTGEIEGRPGLWYLEYRGHPVYVITDEAADRMRIIVQIAPVGELDRDILFRMMQANFDSALDARYAIARGVLWSAFIHPLSPLSDDQFRSGFAQAETLADTYGAGFSSGGLRFRGGDSDDSGDSQP